MSCHSRSPAVEVVFEHQQYEQWPWWHLWTSEKHVSALTVTLHGAFKRACQPATWFSAICILFYLPSNNLSKSMGASSAVKQPAADLRYVDCNRQWCVWLLDLKNEHGITERCLKVCQVRIKLHPKKNLACRQLHQSWLELSCSELHWKCKSKTTNHKLSRYE